MKPVKWAKRMANAAQRGEFIALGLLILSLGVMGGDFNIIGVGGAVAAAGLGLRLLKWYADDWFGWERDE